METRPNPDELLKALTREEERTKKGKLHVFFGMSAGVGKTYAMLEAAHERVKEKVDLVVGIVETHGRSDTARLLSGLEIIPKKKLDYRGTEMEEMDLDAI